MTNLSDVAKEVTPYWYDLPESRIAQRPVYPPESAKMLVVDRRSGELRCTNFFDFPSVVRDGDLLLYNDTAVIRARLFGLLAPSNIEVELLLVEELEDGSWKAMGRPLRRLSVGREISFQTGLWANIIERLDAYFVRIRFSGDGSKPLRQQIDSAAVMPIPPYIREGRADDQDTADYQTFFAANPGSIAAPTASLHFTPALMDAIRLRGCTVLPVTLHVGVASFKSVYSNDSKAVEAPSEEKFNVSMNVISTVRATKAAGGRVFALGTTVARAIESGYANPHETSQSLSKTSLFITPGYSFRALDALITNFHQPGSTHLLLVQALLGERLLKSSYEYALANEFRFFSYGDGMVII